MKFTLIKLAAACAALLWAFAVTADDAPRIGYVRPLVGTDGFGNVYPGAQVPFGGIQISPDTDDDYYDAASGYKYAHKTLMGFSLNHLSGTGIPDLGDFLFMPGVGEIKLEPGTHDDPDAGYRSRYSHDEEWCSPAYYGVNLTDYGVKAEMTAAQRSGILRFTYPEADDAFILVDMRHTLWWKCRWANLRKEDDHTITGYKLVQGWGAERHVYFVAEFSEPLDDFGIMEGGKRVCYDTKRFRSDCEAWGEDLKFWVRFATRQEQQVTVRVAISSVDPAAPGAACTRSTALRSTRCAAAASNCGSGSFRGSRSRARSGLRRRFTPRRTAVSSLRSFSRMRTAASASTTRVSGAPRDLPTIRPFRSGTPTAPSIR